ncbi:ABC transporter ATP-binding protein [Planctomicrobium sp. SH668]|uniref:ABC transporter ATP-binding protein n=1 Tax=Planctomicrobium sp. SH668 TaxID=3448126 RepID=UPI003F5B1F91
MNSPVISCQNLSKQFQQEVALKGITMQIEPGHVVGLIGTNGSGKSTLLRCLLGLLRPTSGNCEVFGETSWTLSDKSKARLGYVSQDFSLLPWMKVHALCHYTGCFYETWDHAYVETLLRDWDLPREKRVSTLSIGQRQKLAVILAMGHRPELLILDEPVASLDPIARRQFLQSLIDLSIDERHTTLFSTHITSDLERVASHVAFLEAGKLKFYGELDSLKENCKRLRIHSASQLPPHLNIKGTIRSEVSEQHATVTVSEIDEETVPTIEQQWNARVSIEDLNLEEIFLELSGVSATQEPVKVGAR